MPLFSSGKCWCVKRLPSGLAPTTFFAMSFQQQINAAIGYFNLGMTDDALLELESMSQADFHRPESIALRVSVLMRKGLWEKALEGAELLCTLLPEHPSPYLDAAFCLHEMKRTEEARRKLLAGPAQLKGNSLFYYNMACYESRLNHLDVARKYLEQALSMNRELENSWESDPDLALLKNT
jgi:tetratricopeptide (TPR) repeat protein